MSKETRPYLIPKESLMVRKPNGELLKAEGEYVTPETYWNRRLNDGDVTKGTPAKSPKKDKQP